MSFIKKILFSYLLSIILTTALFANKIDLTTHGRLSLGYFGNSFGFLNTSAFGLNAYVMADFGITEHWSIGMGATGIWNIWSLFPFNNIMTSIGDVSDIYILYKNDNFKIIIGRFNASQGKTEMITNGFFNGPLQGVAVSYKTSSATTLWFSYINSWLNNGFMPGRIGSDLKGLSPYFADGKITIGGCHTVQTMGLYDKLLKKNSVFWHWKNSDYEAKRRAELEGDVYICSANGVAETAKPGFTLIDMSSIDPVESKKIGEELAKKGCKMLDAPVSGGEPKAIDGTLSVMVGGAKEDFDKFLPVLKAMAGSVTYVGELGAGNIAKLANQIVVACNIAAVAEALTFSKKVGADPELVYQAIRGGLAGSTVMDAKAPMMMAGNYKPGFRIELHIKDLTNALNAAHAVNAPVPLTGEVMEMMQSLKAYGFEKDDHSALARYYEKISDTSIVK